MVIDAVDHRNRPIGTIMRKDVFKSSLGFRTVHVFIFNSSGQLLVQQQSRKRDRAPLSWGSSVAAYLFAGESYESAARRRVWQELGVKPGNLRLVGTVKTRDLGHDKFVGLVTGVWDGRFHFDHNHIEKLEFLAPQDIQRVMREGTWTFTPTFVSLFKFYRRNRGKSSPRS